MLWVKEVYSKKTHVPYLKFHPLSVYDDCSNFKVNTDGCDVRPAKCVVGESYE